MEVGLSGSSDKGKNKGRVGRERTMSKKIVHVIKRVSHNNRKRHRWLRKPSPDTAEIGVSEKLSLESKARSDHMIKVGVALDRRDFPGVESSATPSLLLSSLLPKLFLSMPRITPDIVNSRNVLGGPKDRVFKTNLMRTISRIDHREEHQQPIQPYPSNRQVSRSVGYLDYPTDTC